ncbi:MAG: peptide-methionine (R)-S-oxide reductase MsrB [Flavobacteriaceae bacterium]
MVKQIIFILVFILAISCKSKAQNDQLKPNSTMSEKIKKTDAEWKAVLTPQEYYVLRQAGTDAPSEEGYTAHFKKGTYHCRACDTKLFESGSKFQSHCGWPSFDDAIEGTIIYKEDTSGGRVRTEIICAKCDGHLGHVFTDGPKETTGKRYCVNTTSIKFVE